MRRLPLRPSPATTIACIALFVSLGGVGYATLTLPANSVGTHQLKPGAVTRTKIANNAVNSAKIADGTLLKTDFLPGQMPSGSAWALSDGLDPLPNPSLTIRTITVTVPRPGMLLVIGSAEIFDWCKGPGTCFYEYGLYLDGNPIPKSANGYDFAAGREANRLTFASVVQVQRGTRTLAIAGKPYMGTVSYQHSAGYVSLDAVLLGAG